MKLRETIKDFISSADIEFPLSSHISNGRLYLTPHTHQLLIGGYRIDHIYMVENNDGDMVAKLSKDDEHVKYVAMQYMNHMLNHMCTSGTFNVGARLYRIYNICPKLQVKMEDDVFILFNYLNTLADEEDKKEKSKKLIRMLSSKYRKLRYEKSNRQ